jgi:hypothetical protein
LRKTVLLALYFLFIQARTVFNPSSLGFCGVMRQRKKKAQAENE